MASDFVAVSTFPRQAQGFGVDLLVQGGGTEGRGFGLDPLIQTGLQREDLLLQVGQGGGQPIQTLVPLPGVLMQAQQQEDQEEEGQQGRAQ